MQLQLGDIVYLKTDKEQHGRIVTGICQRETGYNYNLAFGITESWHYLIEISQDRDIILATTN